MRIAQIGPGDCRRRTRGNVHPAEVDIGKSRCRLDECLLVVQLDREHAGDQIDVSKKPGRSAEWRWLPVGGDAEWAKASGTNRLPEAQ